MVVVGLTGGIGSGKSTVAREFKALNVIIIDADVIACQLTEQNAQVFDQIVRKFGYEIIQDNGMLNRIALKEIIFNNADKRKWLEGFLHPLIRKKIVDKIQKIQGDYCIVVIPLLSEAKRNHDPINFIDRVLVVDSPENLQVHRTMSRDTLTALQANKIIQAQATRQERLALADDVIINDADMTLLKHQVLSLDKLYKKINREKYA